MKPIWFKQCPEFIPELSSKKLPPYFYGNYYDDGCVLCGARSSDEHRYRVYGMRPLDDPDKYDHYAGQHACQGHFM